MLSSSICIDIHVRIFTGAMRMILMKELWKMENILKIFIMVVLIATSTTSADLVGHWKFDEGIGTIAYDSSICGNNGFLIGNPQWVAGHLDRALEFDGTGDWVDCGTRPVFGITGAVSISAWIKVTAQAADRIDQKIAGNQDGANGGYKMGLFRNKIEFEIRTSDNANILNRRVAGGTEIKVGVWYHVAGVYSPEEDYIRTYVNGVLDRELRTNQLLGASQGSFKIGCEPSITGLCNFNGVIDDLRIYNHAIDETEIMQLYNNNGKSSVTPAFRKLNNELHRARTITEKQEPEKAIVFIEKTITEYELWKEKQTKELDVRYEFLLSDLYFLLAKTREAANAPTNDVAVAYKQAISQQSLGRDYVPALLWLFKNVPTDDYVDIIKKSVRAGNYAPDHFCCIARDFESSKNWTAFELFLDGTFTEVKQPTLCAEAIAKGLYKGGMWPRMFFEYCRNKPELAKYIFSQHEKQAQEYIAQNDFSKATELYRELVNQCAADRDKSVYELKVCECIFNSGQYSKALPEIDNFINKYKVTNKALVKPAIILRGRAYIQLGEIAQASDTFQKLLVDYPEAKQTPDPNFYIGYCYMLQDKLKEAKEILSTLTMNYPESQYANKARLCLSKIERMRR